MAAWSNVSLSTENPHAETTPILFSVCRGYVLERYCYPENP